VYKRLFKLGVFLHLKQGFDSTHELQATANNTAIVPELLRDMKNEAAELSFWRSPSSFGVCSWVPALQTAVFFWHCGPQNCRVACERRSYISYW